MKEFFFMIKENNILFSDFFGIVKFYYTQVFYLFKFINNISFLDLSNRYRQKIFKIK